ncbi:uncharacterized protein LOC8262894 [Ricinus communis]|uniref:Vacuolar protein sorting-associated protein 62 n=1 Tax=Ricinus communis TaxID=3988 RepID=B9SC61_RICCO|nr:uncharacterized protein LOC8262894 [Ricinus communis]EEF38775.1 conserved hypothetical protein [Ricinus communis]|eukprot:XP_002523580.1 uncharacterized protein LOC8262894 [Ricinus communis]
MGNCLSIKDVSKKRKTLPIETSFKLPSSLPKWPPGEGFGNGTIDLGGLQVCQISSLNKVWSTQEGGPDNVGASFFEPSQIPQGFFMLGCYCQSNSRPLYGWVLAGKDDAGGALEKPIDYTLVWSSESLKIKQDSIGYIWLPTAPDGYRAVGLVVTSSPEKPSLDKMRCVRSDLTDQCEKDIWVWGPEKQSDPNGFNVFSLRPSNRGTQAMGVCVGTFVAQNGNDNNPASLVCLKNVSNNLSCMPNENQIQAIFQAYSPWIYFHPDEEYLPSSVSWYFNNGALLYKQGEESNPVKVETNGSNLPQGGANDGVYWLDLPVDEKAKDRVKKGDLQETEVYLHIKPMFGATFTDIVIWVFCPFNGPAKAKIEFLNVPLGKIGEHVGDWEHVTLRVSNFNSELWSVYFSEHSGGSWINASQLEFQSGNKFVGYSSLHGHAMYSKPGLVLQGNNGIGIRNDTAKSGKILDTGAKFSVVAAEYLGMTIIEPPWINFFRKWGPKISYNIADEIKKIEKILPGKLKSAFEKVVNGLPSEVLGEEGPTGPKVKGNWTGDES